jgi:hypothetical protein
MTIILRTTRTRTWTSEPAWGPRTLVSICLRSSPSAIEPPRAHACGRLPVEVANQIYDMWKGV